MRQKGMSMILVVVLAAVVLLVIAYFVMMNMNAGTSQTNTNYTPVPASALPSAEPVSEDESTDSMQTELENTSSGSIDSELNQIDYDASSL